MFGILLETIMEEPVSILVDLSGVELISSMALGSIANGVQKARNLERKIYFRLSAEVEDVFRTTGIHGQVEII
jgi:anti-anti-sigma regulatory factor